LLIEFIWILIHSKVDWVEIKDQKTLRLEECEKDIVVSIVGSIGDAVVGSIGYAVH
jgi:hypothetical protein